MTAWTNPSAIAPPSVPASSDGAAERRQRQPVEEAGLDIGGQVGARVEQSEDRALDERHGEGEAQVGVGREPGNRRRRVEPGRVHREQEEREDQRGSDRRRLADRAEEGTSSDLEDALATRGAHAGDRLVLAGGDLALLSAGALELPAGLVEEDVVERRGVQLQVGELDAGRVELANDALKAVVAGSEADRDRGVVVLEVLAAGAEAAHHLDQAVAIGGVERGRLDRRLADLGLELR